MFKYITGSIAIASLVAAIAVFAFTNNPAGGMLALVVFLFAALATGFAVEEEEGLAG